MEVTLAQAMEMALGHHHAGRSAAAESIYRQVLAVEPNHPDAWHLLGVIASQNQQFETAIERINRAIQVNPESPNYRFNLGYALLALDRRDEAAAAFQAEIERFPDAASAHNNLGIILAGKGRRAEAIGHYRKAVELMPNYAEALSNLGVELGRHRQFAEASSFAHQAVGLAPARADLSYNLATVLRDGGESNQAVEVYQRAIALDSSHLRALNDLGGLLLKMNRWDEAEQCLLRALALSPHFAWAQNNLAGLWKDSGRVDEAIRSYRHTLEGKLTPDSRQVIQANLLIASQYQEGLSQRELLVTHRAIGASFTSESSPKSGFPNNRAPSRRLRVGFVSPNFCFHPVGHFLVRLLENISTEAFEVICYSDTLMPDAMTRRLEAASARWREVAAMTADELSRIVREDEVDILFDLAGWTPGNRLEVFACRAAPLQITWMDYVGTTGVPAIDYLLADSHEVPPGAEAGYAEKILRMPHGYICFDPPAEAPEVSSLPAATNGFITFGSFNILAKTGPQTIALWAKILQRVPNAKLMLKNRGFESAKIKAHYLASFASHGISEDRIIIEGWASQSEVLAAYGKIDVALDPLAYNGGLTTCEAIWMGVPVITCPGERFASRHSLTHLSAAGLTETIALTPEGYVDIAAKLAGDLPHLAKLRAGMREAVAGSPLCDGVKFARGFEALMRRVWVDWCKSAET